MGALQPINEILTIYLPAFLYMMEVIGKIFSHGLNIWKQHASIVEGISRQNL